MQTYNYQHPVYAKDPKDIPQWLKDGHRWLPPVDFNKLPKHQLKVRMCCPKCEEKVVEEICEVPGVFDVRASWMDKKVVVIAMPEPIALDEDVVLRKARKIDRKARFVALDPSERSKTESKRAEKSQKPETHSHKQTEKAPKPDESSHAVYTTVTLPLPSEYRRPRPPNSQILYQYPPEDGYPSFYFLLFIILFVAMYIFKK